MLIWKNFKALYLKIGTKKRPHSRSHHHITKSINPAIKTATQPKIKPFQAVLAPSANPM